VFVFDKSTNHDSGRQSVAAWLWGGGGPRLQECQVFA
jgi:hypothetical protein